MNKSNKVKKGCIIVLVILLLIAVIVGVIVFTNKTSVDSDLYFIRYEFDYETRQGTSTIYQYDADEDKVYEIGTVRGPLNRSAVNEEHTHIIGLVNTKIIMYDLETNEIIKEVSLNDLEERAGLESASIRSANIDFTDDGSGVYINMQKSGKDSVYLYDFQTDEFSLIAEGEDMDDLEYVDNNIFYRKDRNIVKYDIETGEEVVIVSGDVRGFKVSPNGEKILYHVRETSHYSVLYLYDFATEEITKVEEAHGVQDIGWLKESYVYVETYRGVLCDANPTVKISLENSERDEVIYRIKGFLKGGTIYLVENPEQ